jgi:hypothetical protein
MISLYCLGFERLSLFLIEEIIYLAANFDCNLVLFGSGEIFEPKLPLVVEKVK